MKPEYPQAWEARLEATDSTHTFKVDNLGNVGGSPGQLYVNLPNVNLISIKTVIDKLKILAELIETDIAHFMTFKGQSMAVNRFSFLKREVLDNVARLEKACQTK